MTKTELLEIIHNGESSGVEFKRDDIDPRALAKEIVALANLHGGRILLGVEDEGAVSGVVRPKPEEWVMTVCRDKIRPEIIPFFELVRDVDNSRTVAVIQIDPGWTVHAVWHNNGRTYYIRVGTESREASQEELERLFQQRGLFRLETRPVSGASFDALDIRRLKDYFVKIREQAVPEDQDRAGWQRLLENTELMATSEAGYSCTVAGILLFGKEPNRFLPQAGIDAVSYPGNQPDYAANERLPIRGPMLPLLSEAGIVENGLVESCVDFVKRHIPDQTVMENGVRRVTKDGFPVGVLREAIVNALVHRDYLLSATDVQLSIFADRLEIRSPGRLPNGITPAMMITGCRAARNQLIKDVMRDYGYLEHMGMGIPRKIVAGMKAFNGTEPQLIVGDEVFTVILHR
ncbi:MAG: ATP-binding protein [Verrucomicrobiota bacterium]|jgi:ATP-dependent DNA helicase RecG